MRSLQIRGYLSVRSGTVRRCAAKYAERAMATDTTDQAERFARVERIIEEYRAARRRLLLERSMKLWRRAEACQRVMALEAQPKRIH